MCWPGSASSIARCMSSAPPCQASASRASPRSTPLKSPISRWRWCRAIGDDGNPRGGPPMNAAELASQFRIAGVVEFGETEHGLARAQIALGGMTGELFLQGAQVTAWQPSGQRPVIFTSPNAVFAPGKAIRGGIPVIFPWFGPHPTDPKAPQHGVVRAADWRLDRVER